MKTQEQYSQQLVGPVYKNPETGQQFGEKIGKDSQRNRENQISRKDDTHQNIKVGIRDIDEAIIYYFNNVILPRAYYKGKVLTVPVLYGSPERWFEVQRNGFLRDKEGKRQIPAIIFKRNSLDKNRTITKLDANRPHNFYVTNAGYTRRNRYDRFSVLHNRIPEKEFMVTVIPDYVKMDYSCVILTDFMEQMNGIVEAILFATDSYWGEEDRFKFQSFIDGFKTEILTNQGEDRVIRTEFNIKVSGYILPETVNAGPYVNTKRYRKTTFVQSFSEGVTDSI